MNVDILRNFCLNPETWCQRRISLCSICHPIPLSFSRLVHLHMDELGYISQWRAIFAGGLAGVAAALVTYPLEVVETRLIVQNCRQPTYIGVAHTLSKIYRAEGLQALYRGFSLTVVGSSQHLHICKILFICIMIISFIFLSLWFMTLWK